MLNTFINTKGFAGSGAAGGIYIAGYEICKTL